MTISLTLKKREINNLKVNFIERNIYLELTAMGYISDTKVFDASNCHDDI